MEEQAWQMFKWVLIGLPLGILAMVLLDLLIYWLGDDE